MQLNYLGVEDGDGVMGKLDSGNIVLQLHGRMVGEGVPLATPITVTDVVEHVLCRYTRKPHRRGSGDHKSPSLPSR